VRPAREGQQQVRGERPLGQTAGGGDLSPHLVRRQESDCAEASRAGDGRRQPMAREAAAHAGLDDG
jgi:hypothetical protein